MVPGKLVHSVPILLTEEMKQNVDLLVSCRLALQIPSENKLPFARVHTMKPFDGSKIIRDYRGMCKLNKPNDFTSIGLRHHIATKSQIVENPNYTENICQFMGHSSNAHKQNYRLPLQAIQKGQLGCHLMKMAGNDTTIQTPPNQHNQFSFAVPATTSTPTTNVHMSRDEIVDIQTTNSSTPTKRKLETNQDEIWQPPMDYSSESSTNSSPARKKHKKE